MTCLLFFHVLLMQFLASPSLAQAPSKLDCNRTCGDVDIPYPFGLEQSCALSKGFELNCTKTDDGSYKPFVFNVEVLNISLPQGQARMMNPISSQCYNSTTKNITSSDWRFNFLETPFRFSSMQNKFTAIGTRTLAYIYLQNSTSIWYKLGCVSVCSSINGLVNGRCSGMGCCQSAIPSGMNYYEVNFDRNYNNSDVSSFSPCSYAVLMEADRINFSTTYITTSAFTNENRGQFPIVMDWTIGNKTCMEAEQNKTSYACISDNSVCIDSPNGPGYFCKCSKGYNGNPYLHGGCTGFVYIPAVLTIPLFLLQSRHCNYLISWNLLQNF